MSEKKKQQEVKLDVKIDDATAHGQYVNLAVVNYNESEFVVDMIFVQPQSPRADVRSRVILSPKNAKRLVHAMQESIERFEQAFGEIVPPKAPIDESTGGYH
ncbi:MAG: DUF3467 domain-containing protein [Desulfuromonadales bacterium]|nr:DUF3467 domain-containing protein [Desulfuromonadales bacterium]